MTYNYYQKHEEKLQKQARKRYQSLFEEEKKKDENWSQEDIKT